MPEKPANEKTEPPTPRKLSKAKSEGQVPQSQELNSVVSIIVLTAITVFWAPNLMQWFSMQIMQGLSNRTAVFDSNKAFISFLNTKIISSILLMCPFFAALVVGSVLAGVAVSGLNYAPKAVKFKLGAINPIKGFGNLMNTRTMVLFLVSILKLIFVSLIVWQYLHSKLDTLATLRWAWSVQIIVAIAKIILGMMVRICIALLVISIADVFYQKWKYIQELKMTKQEVKEERRDTEGLPEVKTRIRRVQFEMAAKRMLQEVPKANVVLVNPTHVAVALRYEPKTMEAPVLVAKGADLLAEKINRIARAYGVPVVRRPELARTIYSTVKLGSLIPKTLYMAVAEVLAMIYRLRHRK
jgi:flagellar biosynthetic protein FlhB